MSLSREMFQKIPDNRQQAKVRIPLVDHLMCALGIFAFKFPSLLQFEERVRAKPDGNEAYNFKSLFGVERPPDDTCLRQTLDEVKPDELRPVFKKVFAELQRGKALEDFVFYKGTYLLSVDGTGYFSSHAVHCQNCCVKNHRDGTKTFYHQMLGASLVHPDKKQVVPFAPEPIANSDGSKKNDCERNAARRLLKKIREDHPRLPITITEDALASNVPHIKDLKVHKFRFILGIKPGSQKTFFERLEEDSFSGLFHVHREEEDGFVREYRFRNEVLLKEDDPDSEVNFLECKETNKKGVTTTFTWITDFEISKRNCKILMRGGRSRWKIENETFNTLKNQGYEFEHNFGHGNKHLSTVFAMLMMLAFAIDQVSFLCDKEFVLAKQRAGIYKSLWQNMLALFQLLKIPDWDSFIGILSGRIQITMGLNSS